MTSPFEIVAQRLGDLGVYNFLLPWLITTAVMWALLQKSKILGEDAVVVNSVVSISVSFFLWGFLIFSGVDIGPSLSKFFTQMIFIAIGFTVMLVIGSIFFPDFTQTLKDKIPSETMFWIVVVIGLLLLIGTGLFKLGDVVYNVLQSFTKVPGGDVGLLVVAVIFLVILLMVIGGMGGG